MEFFFETIHYVWQDREIKFDTQAKNLRLRTGEIMIDKIDSVEDTKGNNGVAGKILITNLRLIWMSTPKPTLNLSIGLKCITNINSRMTSSKLKGNVESLYIFGKCNKNQFEFIFTNLGVESPKLFSTVRAVHRAYETSRLYREVKLRGAIVDNKLLKLLPKEQQYDKITGVMNLHSDHGTLGTMYITNVRVAWHANTNDSFNISIPYLQITKVRIRDSKFGAAMVLETVQDQQSSGYILGFRIDPQEKLKAAVQEIHSLYLVFSKNPIFGLEYQLESLHQQPPSDDKEYEQIDDDVEVVEMDRPNNFAAYFADSSKAADREPVFNSELGLAIERLPSGYTLKDLWEVN